MVHLKWVKQEIEAEKLLSVASLVISVKFGKVAIGIYIFPKAELIAVVLGSFDFTDDHTHGFCMDSVVWSDEDFLSCQFYCGKIYFVFSWNWVFVQPLNKILSLV